MNPHAAACASHFEESLTFYGARRLRCRIYERLRLSDNTSERRRLDHFLALALGLWLALAFASAHALETPGQARPVETAIPVPATAQWNLSRIRIAEGRVNLPLRSDSGLRALTPAGAVELGPGLWRLTLRDARPAPHRFHVFVKSFPIGERAGAQTYAAEWRAQGFDPLIRELGRTFPTQSGALLDNRILWVSLGCFSTQREADEFAQKLRPRGVFGWVRLERTGPGSGTIECRSGNHVFHFAAPLRLEARGLIEAPSLDGGKSRFCSGTMLVDIGTSGAMDLFEEIAFEEYLKGVLPSEMPALWPAEALRSQAVAARTDALGNLAVKHELEGFEFCAEVHCRMYRGQGARHAAADAAVEATAGEVLAQDGRIVPAVFSSNCGGWTEDNDTVWSAPPDPALRGVADSARVPAEGAPAAHIRAWVTSRPAAYCAGDAAYYRWTRRYTGAELRIAVEKQRRVGAIRSIILGDRGVSGRLKWVEINGTEGSARIEKESAIRQVFGGLPSAAFVLDKTRDSRGNIVYTFCGAGRGHGVGMCQHGARGMALAGKEHGDILRHYYTGTRIERLK